MGSQIVSGRGIGWSSVPSDNFVKWFEGTQLDGSELPAESGPDIVDGGPTP